MFCALTGFLSRSRLAYFGIGTGASAGFIGLVPPGLALPEADGLTAP